MNLIFTLRRKPKYYIVIQPHNGELVFIDTEDEDAEQRLEDFRQRGGIWTNKWLFDAWKRQQQKGRGA